MTGALPDTIMDTLAIGRGALAALHASLRQQAPEQIVTVLQDAGFASGEGLYHAFLAWLPDGAGVDNPDQLDAERLGPTLSRFFEAQGWGRVELAPLAGGALAVDSPDWAEAAPGSADAPMCFFSAGMLADFLGRLSGAGAAVMEVECRSKGDARCRFLSAMPETLQRVYEGMTDGRTYEDALGA